MKKPKPITKRQFDRLKPSTRRMRIAQDVLYTLSRQKHKRFTVTPGRYCEFGGIEARADGITEWTEISTILKKNEP